MAGVATSTLGTRPDKVRSGAARDCVCAALRSSPQQREAYCVEALLARTGRGRGFSAGGSSLPKKLKMLPPLLPALPLPLPLPLLVATPSKRFQVTVTLAPMLARG